MTKKNLILAAGMLAVLVCPTLAVLALHRPRPQISMTNDERIYGMKRTEVEAKYGPAVSRSKNHSSFPLWIESRIIVPRPVGGPAVATSSSVDYIEQKAEVRIYTVYFDKADRVVGQEWGPPLSFLEEYYYLWHFWIRLALALAVCVCLTLAILLMLLPRRDSPS